MKPSSKILNNSKTDIVTRTNTDQWFTLPSVNLKRMEFFQGWSMNRGELM